MNRPKQFICGAFSAGMLLLSGMQSTLSYLADHIYKCNLSVQKGFWLQTQPYTTIWASERAKGALLVKSEGLISIPEGCRVQKEING